ncbi:MAG TPA: hypothetical protein VEQ85_02640, partial [Lacipirellulaceae bacterium]|nr:hypothetical protein [Lacipirellulaceae bacterium]
MDHLPNPRRRRWNAFTALLLVLAALAAVNFVAPELFAQAGESAPGATVTQPAGEAIEQVEGNWKGALKVAIVIALFVGPVLVGAWLARTLRMPDHGWKFALAIGVVAAAAVVVSTGEIKLGPDLSGGITLIYELADESDHAAPAAQPAATGEASTNDASDDPATQEQDAGEGADAADAGAAAAADAEADAPDAEAAEDDSATDEPASDDS